jgi:zinc D-Ala-D-Ala carboxypeptidase
MNLTLHFTLEELTFSSTATARGIDNTAPPNVAANLQKLAIGLERVRAVLNAPLHIDSGYRSPELNQIVRGVPTSAHLAGFAADFICPEFGSPLQIVEKIKECGFIQFDQLIQEGTWVHISFAPAMRQEVLTAHFDGGAASYTQGA